MTEVADTSIQALQKKIEEGSDLTDRQRCFRIVKEYGPITMEEMETSMGKNKHTFTGRIRELKDAGIVEKVGTKNGHQLLDLTDRSGLDEKEWVNDLSKLDPIDTDEDLGLFEDDEQQENDKGRQEDVKPEAGEVIWG